MKQHIKNFLSHCYVVLCCIALAKHGICAGTFILWLSAFLMLPVKNLQGMFREKIPKWGIVKAIAVFMLFFVGMTMLPTDTKEEQSLQKDVITKVAEMI